MRYIPQSLKNKCLLLEQNKEHNADPRLESIIMRKEIPIDDYDLWQTAQVANFTGRVSIAVRRPDYKRMPDRIFIGGIDSGTIKVYAAAYNGLDAPKTWGLEFSIPDAVDVSLAFIGRYRQYKRGRTEFYTTQDYPWIFWIDSSGDLYGQYWDDETTRENLGADATSVCATMGINSIQNEWGYGLLVAWTTTAGDVFYRSYFDGVWGLGIQVTQAPANAVEVVIARAADWRMVFLVKDNSGAVTALFFRSIAISMSNWERVEILNVSIITAGMVEVTYYDTFTDEYVEISAIEITNATKCSILEPAPRSAYNIDDGEGNHGRLVMLEFYDDVYDFVASDFSIKGTSGSTYGGLNVSRPEGKDKNWLLIEFMDFNNAPGNCTITYTPGTLSSGVTAAQLFTIIFTPTGLIPTVIDPPVVLTVTNIEGVDDNA